MRTCSILLFAAMLVLGCQKTPSTVHLSGTLEKQEGLDTVYLYRSADRVSYREWVAALDTAVVEDDGGFLLSCATEEPDLFQVAGDKGYPFFQDVYLEPGDSVDVHAPFRTDSTRVTFTGDRAGGYEIHHLTDSLWRNDTNFQKNYYDIAQMDIDSAWTFLGERYSTRMSLVEDAFADHPEWDVLEKINKQNTYYRSAKDFYDYLYYHNYYSNDTFLYLIPDDQYYSFLDTTLLFQPPKFYSFEYMSFLSAFLRDRFNRDYRSLDDSTMYAQAFPLMLATAQKHLSGEALDKAYLAITDEFAFYLSQDNFFEELDAMDKSFAESHNSKLNYEKFQFIKDRFDNLRPGSTAPDIALPDVEGDTVRLSDHLGKVVYVDFWGTWCFPCLQEMPHSLELQEAYADQPVEFVYIGLQSGEDQIKTWKEFILGETNLSYAPFLDQMAYPGIHLLSEGQFGNPALQPYMLRAAPTYVLIGADGKLISANAPRPGSEEIRELIDAALVDI